MGQADPPGAPTSDQRTVLRHLVQITPAAHTARDVSRHTGLDVPAAGRYLHALQRFGYVGPGRPPGGQGAPPETVAYRPTLTGLGYVRVRPEPEPGATAFGRGPAQHPKQRRTGTDHGCREAPTRQAVHHDPG